MAEHHISDRTDDADARGEHDYSTHRRNDTDQPVNNPVHREPNTYVAGEHGTQQVTAPSGSTGPEKTEGHTKAIVNDRA